MVTTPNHLDDSFDFSEDLLAPDDEFTFDDNDWDIGHKGGEVTRYDFDQDSPEFMKQFIDNGFGDIAPEGYGPYEDLDENW